MAFLDFNSGSSQPADLAPDFVVPTGFQAGEVSGVGTFFGDGIGINSGWISTQLSGANTYARITWSDTGVGSSSRGPIFVNTSGDGYLLLARSSDIRFFSIVSGSLTQIGADISQSSVEGDEIEIRYLGSGSFTFHHNGIEVGSETDTTVTSGLTPGFVCRNSSSHIDAFSADALAGAPTITDINTTNEVVPGATATITGTNLINTTGFTVGGVAQTAVTAVNDTTVTFTVVKGGNPYNQNLTAELTSLDGVATITIQQAPESGTFAVTAASPNTTDDASLWTGLVDTVTGNPVTIVDGDQAWVKNPNNLTNLAIAPDGTITADQTGDFVVQIWLASEGVWGSDQTVTFTDGAADETGPVITSVNVPTAGSYGIGDTLSFTVNWDEAATVTGTPRLPLNLATGTVYADYASGSGTTALVFSYTVQEGDNDADGITLGNIELNGGTIQDAATNAANLTLNSVGSTAGVLVDGVRPVITVTGNNPYTVELGTTYSDPGATASDNQDGSLGSVTGTGSVDTNTEGEYTITYSGSGVTDAAGNAALDVTRTVNVVAELPVGLPSGRAIGLRNSIRAAIRSSIGTSIH